MWGGGPLPSLIPSQSNSVLPNGLKHSTVILILPNPIVNVPVTPAIIYPAGLFPDDFFPTTLILLGTR